MYNKLGQYTCIRMCLHVLTSVKDLNLNVAKRSNIFVRNYVSIKKFNNRVFMKTPKHLQWEDRSICQ